MCHMCQMPCMATSSVQGGNLPQWCPRTPQEDSLRSIFAGALSFDVHALQHSLTAMYLHQRT